MRDEFLDLGIVVSALAQELSTVLTAQARTSLHDRRCRGQTQEQAWVLELANAAGPSLRYQPQIVGFGIIEQRSAEVLVYHLDWSTDRVQRREPLCCRA